MVNEKKAYLPLFICATLLLFSITVSNYNNTAAFRPMNSGSLPTPAPVPSTIPSPAPVPSTIPKSSNTLNFIDYSNSALGIALQYPADWNIVSVKNGIQFVKEKDTSYVEIRVHEVKSDKIDLKQYAEDNIADRKKSREGFKLIDDVSQTTIAGNLEAYKATYTFSKSEDSAKGDTQKISRLWTLLGDKLYTLAYVSPPDTFDIHISAADGILNSMHVGEKHQSAFSVNEQIGSDNEVPLLSPSEFDSLKSVYARG